LTLAPTLNINGTTLNLQADIFNKIMPGLLPLALVLGSWYLVKRRVSPILLLVVFMVAALIGSYPFFGPAPQTTSGDNCGSAVLTPYGPCAAPTVAP
jgi:hypothetical protein